jgi:DNA-binding FadR family transcriptional regulator
MAPGPARHAAVAGGSTVALLRARIAAGDYGPGGRLPSERRLIAEMGVGRTELRKALDTLEREGAIWRHVGKGTFVHDGGGEARTAVSGLARRTTPVKMIRARLAIEPAIAREAAINASAEAIARMRLAMQRARAAASWREYEAHDDAFHRSLAEASDNLPLLAIFDQLNAVRRAVAWGSVERQSPRPPAGHASFAEHERIAEAIEARDPEAAHAAMRVHLRSVAARLFGE